MLMLLAALQIWVYANTDVAASLTDRLSWLGISLFVFKDDVPNSVKNLRDAVSEALHPTGTGLDPGVNVRRIRLSTITSMTEDDLYKLTPKKYDPPGATDTEVYMLGRIPWHERMYAWTQAAIQYQYLRDAIDESGLAPGATLGELERKEREIKIPGISVTVERRMGFWVLVVTNFIGLLLLLSITNTMHIVPLPRADECDWILLYPSKLATFLATVLLSIPAMVTTLGAIDTLLEPAIQHKITAPTRTFMIALSLSLVALAITVYFRTRSLRRALHRLGGSRQTRRLPPEGNGSTPTAG
jgi:hypothetical protein